MDPIRHRYDFVYFFDVTNGNPNGDPDVGNLPRIDPLTGLGLVTDVCLKRKIRNYVSIAEGDRAPFEIYLKDRAILNQQHQRAKDALGISDEEPDGSLCSSNSIEAAREWMCRNFYDVRSFGAVMSTGVNCGQVRGPVQITFARSVEPIELVEHATFRTAVVTEAESERQRGVNRTLVHRAMVPYGLYRAHGFVSPHFAHQTGFSEADLELLWNALENLFETDRSASRGEMCAQGLYIFRHESRLGNAPAHALFRRIQVERVNRDGPPPRRLEDYEVRVDPEQLPQGVEMIVRRQPL
jgi:CRISPR-associated protein Csd2